MGSDCGAGPLWREMTSLRKVTKRWKAVVLARAIVDAYAPLPADRVPTVGRLKSTLATQPMTSWSWRSRRVPPRRSSR
jgi:hypothetical protein